MKNIEPLRHSFAVQRRVVGSLLMREILTRYGRYNIGFLWLFAEPAMFTLIITLIWHYTRAGRISGIPITALAITGYSSLLLWRNIVNRGKHAVSSNNAVLYHRNIKILDVFLSRILLEIAGAVTSFFVLSILFIYIGWMNPPENMLKVISGLFLLAWFGASLSLIIGSLSERFEFVDRLWRPISYILFLFSGVAYIVEWLPLDSQKIILLLPMIHGLELLRDGYFGSCFTAHYDLFYISMCNLCLTLLGLLLVKVAGRRIEAE